MSKWKWWSGRSEEHYSSGPFDSREAAVEALEGEGGWVTEAKRVPFNLSDNFDAAMFIEGAEDDIEHNEDGDLIFDVTKEQGADLENRVRETIDKWQLDQALVFQGYLFTYQRYTEYVNATE